MLPNRVDQGTSNLVGPARELIESESEHGMPDRCELRVAASIAASGSPVGMERVTVGLDDEGPLDQEVDSPDTGEPHLGSDAQSDIGSDEPGECLQSRLRRWVRLTDETGRSTRCPGHRCEVVGAEEVLMPSTVDRRDGVCPWQASERLGERVDEVDTRG
jgi:hypothetical protein